MADQANTIAWLEPEIDTVECLDYDHAGSFFRDLVTPSESQHALLQRTPLDVVNRKLEADIAKFYICHVTEFVHTQYGMRLR
ncbi:hypothetical protein CBM2634_A230008 [Cupriavidus taiwanensis]|uniref:Uncharacterized protein n=1 Tax=Cupriavidus taiwanensis TaxID=164546 RepID=A0A375IYC3_9BURK|nr:hypothetical protein CBM2634_A230008 [Cupriavidus taiwanensis]